jgi:hypothetical protein
MSHETFDSVQAKMEKTARYAAGYGAPPLGHAVQQNVPTLTTDDVVPNGWRYAFPPSIPNAILEPTLPLPPLAPMSFTDFWRANTERLIAKFEERASEYDSRDLDMVGHSIATQHNQIHQTPTEKQLTGCLFYLQGKVSRALSAMFRTKLPSADTCDDMFIYSMMSAWRRHVAAETKQS